MKLAMPVEGAQRCAMPIRPCVQAITRRAPSLGSASGAITMPVTRIGLRSSDVQYCMRQARMPLGAPSTGCAEIRDPIRWAELIDGKTAIVAATSVASLRMNRCIALLPQ